MTFDPYHKWLGISPKDQPANHYRLLGIDLFESDPDVIASAADQRMAHVKSFQTGTNSKVSQRVLNEIAAARVCLLNPKTKAVYDAALAQEPKRSRRSLTVITVAVGAVAILFVAIGILALTGGGQQTITTAPARVIEQPKPSKVVKVEPAKVVRVAKADPADVVSTKAKPAKVETVTVELPKAEPARPLPAKVESVSRGGAILVMSFEKDTFFKKDGKTFVRDLSGKGHDGELQGPVKSVPGKVGDCVEFSGPPSRIVVPGLRFDNFTYSSWVKWAKYEEVFGIMGKVSCRMWGWKGVVHQHMHDAQDGERKLLGAAGIVLKDKAVEWHHIVVTRDGEMMKCYCDGKLASDRSTLSRGRPAINPQEDFYIGAANIRWLEGCIDEVAVFDRAINPAEVEKLNREGVGWLASSASKTETATQASGNTPKVASPAPVKVEPLVDPSKVDEEKRIYLRTLKPEVADFLDHPTVKLTANGKLFQHGIYAHPPRTPNAPSYFKYQIDGAYGTFSGWAGVTDRHVGDGTDPPHSALGFRILGDGKLLWKSEPTTQRGKILPFQVSVANVKTLELFVDCVGPQNGCDAVWFDPFFCTEGERQVYLSALTPEVKNVYTLPNIKLVAKGVLSQHGLNGCPSPHGPSLYRYQLNGSYETLSGWAAITDESFRPLDRRPSLLPLVFEILGDGEVLWKSPPITKRGEPVEFRVDLTGVKVLELKVEMPNYDRIDLCDGMWFDPVLYSSGEPFDPAEVEKQLKKDVLKATPVDCVMIAQRAVKVAKKTDNHAVRASAKRIATAAAKKSGNADLLRSTLAEVKELK